MSGEMTFDRTKDKKRYITSSPPYQFEPLKIHGIRSHTPSYVFKMGRVFIRWLAPLIFAAIVFAMLVVVAPYCHAAKPLQEKRSAELRMQTRLIYGPNMMKELFCNCEKGELDACNRYTRAYNTGDYDPLWKHPRAATTILWIGEFDSDKKCEVKGPEARADHICEGTVPAETLECLGAGSIPDDLPVLYYSD